MNKLTDQIQAEVNKVVLGKGDIVRKVLLAILAQGHVLLEDVPGVGKTTLAKAFSKTLGLDSKRVQFTSDTLPSDIIGFSVFDKADGKLKYQSGAIMTNLLLADEINRTSSKTQSALLEAMEELQVTVCLLYTSDAADDKACRSPLSCWQRKTRWVLRVRRCCPHPSWIVSCSN